MLTSFTQMEEMTGSSVSAEEEKVMGRMKIRVQREDEELKLQRGRLIGIILARFSVSSLSLQINSLRN